MDFPPPIHSFQFVTEESRRKTFENGWDGHVVSVDKMVQSGFYRRLGCCDRVRCYSCGVQIEGWEEGADPDYWHVRLSPKCFHIVQKKGQDYVNCTSTFETAHFHSYNVLCSLTQYVTVTPKRKKSTLQDEESNTTKRIKAELDFVPQQPLLESFGSEKATNDRPMRARKPKTVTNARKCTFCFLRKPDSMVMPCKHKFCFECAAKMRRCFLCRRQKRDVVFV